MSEEVWTEQDEQQLRELRRRKKAYLLTQQGRKRQFGPKKYKDSSVGVES